MKFDLADVQPNTIVRFGYGKPKPVTGTAIIGDKLCDGVFMLTAYRYDDLRDWIIPGSPKWDLPERDTGWSVELVDDPDAVWAEYAAWRLTQ